MKPVKVNFLIERGDAYLGEDRLEIRVPGDWTSYKLSWVVKLNKESSSKRLIEKNNSLYGGSIDELEAVLDGSDTVFKISLLGEDTGIFQNFKFYHDLVAIDPLDSAKTKTIVKGDFKINYDVQTPYDGFVLPDEDVIYQTVNAEDGGIGDIMLINDSGLFEFYSLSQLKTLLDELP